MGDTDTKGWSLNQIWQHYADGHIRLAAEGAERYFDSLKNVKKAFVPSRGHVCSCCIDERVPDIRPDGLTLRIPGSLIAQPFDEAIGYIRNVFSVPTVEERVIEIASHAHCGTGAMLYEREHPGSVQVGPEVIDAWVDRRTRDFVRKANLALMDEGIRLNYFGQVGISGDPGHHHAFCLYYDARMEGFSPGRVRGMLPGFVLTAGFYAHPSRAMADLAFAVSIAFSKHGFDSKFTPERPFVVIGIGDEMGVQTMRGMFDEALSGLSFYKESRLTIDTVVPHR